jgi:hypothetical protein
MKVSFRTNLDEAQSDVGTISALWPDGHVPRVGEHVQLPGYQLRVVAVSYEAPRSSVIASHGRRVDARDPYQAVVELHGPSWFKGTLGELIDWVKRCRENAR